MHRLRIHTHVIRAISFAQVFRTRIRKEFLAWTSGAKPFASFTGQFQAPVAATCYSSGMNFTLPTYTCNLHCTRVSRNYLVEEKTHLLLRHASIAFLHIFSLSDVKTC